MATFASRISDLTNAIATAVNARAPKVGASAYDIAVINGYTGTQAQWLIDSRAVGVRAHAGATQALTANGQNTINLSTTDYNDNTSVFTVAADGSGITILMAGLYQLDWQVNGSLSAAGTASAYLSGGYGATSDNSAGTGAERNGSNMTRIPANTKLSLLWYSSVTGNTASIGPGANYLAITRLGA